uniref:Uncharacterized protein n=1 Tax=Arion vulgaris TaxID=1028688 RepID=A0A0B7AP78_9EUPU
MKRAILICVLMLVVIATEHLVSGQDNVNSEQVVQNKDVNEEAEQQLILVPLGSIILTAYTNV